MKPLLIVTAVIEVGAGLALLLSPSAVAWALLRSALETPAGLTVGHVAGAALLSLGVACWGARLHGGDPAAGLVAALLLYNVAAVAVLAVAGLTSEQVGVALWPAVGLHAALLIWCLAGLWNQRVNGVTKRSEPMQGKVPFPLPPSSRTRRRRTSRRFQGNCVSRIG